MNPPKPLSRISCVAAMILFLAAQDSPAGSATWNLNAKTNDWNTASNWTPATVPNSPADTATFAVSNRTGVSLSTANQVAGVVFNAGASAFTITENSSLALIVSGPGLTNNSGKTQNFLTSVDDFGNFGIIDFTNSATTNSATAGTLTAFTTIGSLLETSNGGQVNFFNTSNAGNASFINNGAQIDGGFGGYTQFFDTSSAGTATFTNITGIATVLGGGGGTIFLNSSTAASATFTNNGSTGPGNNGSFTDFRDTATAGNGTFITNGSTFSGGGPGGFVEFFGNSTGANGTFTSNGGTVAGANRGHTYLEESSTAGNATLIANGGPGTDPFVGGVIGFFDDSTGGTARVEVFDNGNLDVSFHNPPGITVGSIEGSGAVFIGANNLTVGSNTLDTSFSGVIQDAGAHGTLTKIGAGILTIEGGSGNDHIANTVTLSIADGSTVNLNFLGNVDAVGGLIAAGIAQPAGLYGSAASGAPNTLAVLGGTGMILVGPPVIISPLLATATDSLPFSYQFEAMGATTLAVTGLPAGLTFDPDLRAIIGSPTVTGTFQITLSASNESGTTSATLVLTVPPLPTSGPIINSITSATGRTGSPFYFQVTTTAGSLLTRLTASGLPDDLSVDPVTGIISGTALTDGSFLVTLTATDSGLTNEATLQLTFTSDPTVPVITSSEYTFLFNGIPFSYTLLAPTSDSSDPVTFSVVGTLPTGLDLDPTTGVISGIPKFVATSRPSPQLAGGIISNVQTFACNSNGCGTQSLFFLKPTGAANISTRLSVGTGDNVLIGGFITQGDPATTPMRLMVRGIGTSLPVAGVLADPYLELHSGPTIIASNDNWMDNLAGGSQKDLIEDATTPSGVLAPTYAKESAILAVLDPGAYTAILRGTNNGTGVGLVEVYNLGAACMDILPEARLANISTRGYVQTGDNVMIGGFINQGLVPIKAMIRGIGPSLTQAGVSGALANPVLELHNPDGTVVTNDDWMTTQETDIIATGIPPTDPLESAILITLPVGQGAYTAIMRGANNTTGVGLVEAYFGNPCLGSSCP